MPHNIWRSKSLKSLYNLYNKKYFRGALPDDTVLEWDKTLLKRTGTIGHFGTIKYRVLHGKPASLSKPLIQIDPGLQLGIKRGLSKLVQATLLHEMVHLKLFKDKKKLSHGYKFQREMKRLAKIGAFNTIW